MPSDQSIEQEIQFKKRARRRLVGAVALVLLMVTILPMVLDDRSTKNTQQEIAISIPSQNGTEFSSKVIPVGGVAPEPQLEEAAPSKSSSSEKTESAEPIKLEKAITPKPESEKATPASTEKSPVQASSGDGDAYTVQIGVFSDPANVKKLQQKLKTVGYKSYTEMIDTPKGEKIRLRAGPFTNRESADAALVIIKDAGLSGLVVLNK